MLQKWYWEVKKTHTTQLISAVKCRDALTSGMGRDGRGRGASREPMLCGQLLVTRCIWLCENNTVQLWFVHFSMYCFNLKVYWKPATWESDSGCPRAGHFVTQAVTGTAKEAVSGSRFSHAALASARRGMPLISASAVFLEAQWWLCLSLLC